VKPSRAEKIASVITVAGLVCAIGAPATALYGHLHIADYVGTLCIWAFVASGVVTVVSSIVGTLLQLQRLALMREERERLLRDAAGPPDMWLADSTGAIMTLRWSIDYKTSVRLNMTYGVRNPNLWLPPLIVVSISAVVCFELFGILYAGIFAGGFLGVGIAAVLLSIFSLQLRLKRDFPSAASVHYVGLVVNQEGLHRISGHTMETCPWNKLETVREIDGFVFVVRNGAALIIPSTAFLSQKDARAFVETAVALKKKKAPPDYDWSGYVTAATPTPAADDGVWPPRIR